VDVDAAKMPYVAWHWKVTHVSKRGDFRHFWSDGRAAQVLVAFDGRHALSYNCDTTAESHNVAADYLRAFGQPAGPPCERAEAPD